VCPVDVKPQAADLEVTAADGAELPLLGVGGGEVTPDAGGEGETPVAVGLGARVAVGDLVGVPEVDA